MRVLNDLEFAAEWMSFFGVVTGLRVLGWAAASVIGAPPDADRAWLLKHGFGHESTRYRNVNHLVAFADSLRARNITVFTTDENAPMVRVERILGGLPA